MNRYENQKGLVDVGSDFGGAVGGREPGWGGDALSDDVGEAVGDGAGVGLEDAFVDLGEDVIDGFGFFGEGDGEESFEVGD